MMDLTPEVLDSIAALRDYLYVEERKHYDECKSEDSENHIFEHAHKVHLWLLSQGGDFDQSSWAQKGDADYDSPDDR